MPILRVGVLQLDGKMVDSVNVQPPNRQYGVMALDLKVTPLAYQVLATEAQSDSSEVRGIALRSLAESYYYRAMEDSLVPDKAVVGSLLQNLDDTTHVESCDSPSNPAGPLIAAGYARAGDSPVMRL
jgi:hypothetical protein